MKNKINRLNTLQACTLRTSGRLRRDGLQHAVALCHTDRAELLQSFYKSQACHLLQTKFCLWEEKPVSWNAELTLSTEHSRSFLGSYERFGVHHQHSINSQRQCPALQSLGCSALPNKQIFLQGSSWSDLSTPLINKPIQQLLILSRPTAMPCCESSMK